MTRLRRADPIDILRSDGMALLLFENRLVQLSPLAAAIFDLAADGMELDALARELEAEFGPPSDSSSAEATAVAVDDLVIQAILVWEPTSGGAP